MAFDELLAFNRQLPLDAEAYLHLRKATYGRICHDLAHPYLVREGLLLMHNGSIHHRPQRSGPERHRRTGPPAA
jgi:predicted glutamine amidotransferase